MFIKQVLPKFCNPTKPFFDLGFSAIEFSSTSNRFLHREEWKFLSLSRQSSRQYQTSLQEQKNLSIFLLLHHSHFPSFCSTFLTSKIHPVFSVEYSTIVKSVSASSRSSSWQSPLYSRNSKSEHLNSVSLSLMSFAFCENTFLKASNDA